MHPGVDSCAHWHVFNPIWAYWTCFAPGSTARHSFLLLLQHTDRDAPPWGTWLRTLHWWWKVGKYRRRKKAQHPAGFKPSTSYSSTSCFLLRRPVMPTSAGLRRTTPPPRSAGWRRRREDPLRRISVLRIAASTTSRTSAQKVNSTSLWTWESKVRIPLYFFYRVWQ